MGILSIVPLYSKVKTATIYALIDPRDRSPFYVGVTIRKLSYRLSSHLNDAVHLQMAGSRFGIMRDINTAGSRTEIMDLETILIEHWIDAEQFWIANLKFMGARLTNSSTGGPGAFGTKQSEASNLMRAASAIGRDLSHLRLPEVRARAGAKTAITLTGRKATPEAVLNMSLAKCGEKHNFWGKPRSAETRAKISAAHQGKSGPSGAEAYSRRGLIIDGKAFPSGVVAAAELGIPYHRIRYLLKTGRAVHTDGGRPLAPIKGRPPKGRPKAEKNHNSRPITIDGASYWGVRDAAATLGHGRATIQRWLRNGKAQYTDDGPPTVRKNGEPRKASPAGASHPQAHPVIINGVHYWGIKDAAERLGRGTATINIWLHNGNARYADK